MTDDPSYAERPPSPAPASPEDGAAATRVLARVDRGLAELRLGAALTITAGDTRPGYTGPGDTGPSGSGSSRHPDLGVLAAESASARSLESLQDNGAGPLRVALTGRRAAVLSLAPEGPGPVLVQLADPLDIDAVQRLADPCLDMDAPLPAIDSVEPLDALTSPEGAAVLLAKLARLLPAAVVAPLAESGLPQAATPFGPVTLNAADIFAYQTAAAQSLRPVSSARVPLVGAEETRIVAFRPSDGGTEHLAIIVGKPDPAEPALVRLHSECFTGDLLGSLRCDCGDQLRGAIDAMADQGSGILLYLAQEGRGIGLVNKLRAYQLQDQGFDTLDANGQLGFDDDERIYLPAAEILRQLGFGRVRLLTNNPLKVEALARHGITVVERVPHVYPANPHNLRYLETKSRRGGHLF